MRVYNFPHLPTANNALCYPSPCHPRSTPAPCMLQDGHLYHYIFRKHTQALPCTHFGGDMGENPELHTQNGSSLSTLTRLWVVSAPILTVLCGVPADLPSTFNTRYFTLVEGFLNLLTHIIDGRSTENLKETAREPL